MERRIFAELEGLPGSLARGHIGQPAGAGGFGPGGLGLFQFQEPGAFGGRLQQGLVGGRAEVSVGGGPFHHGGRAGPWL
eukprot:11204358-Lingulodinium_polyedra.AAC.1